jgi:Flp pilus assembly protein TadD
MANVRQGGRPATRDEAERQQAMRCFETGDFGHAARLLVSLLARTPPDPLLLRICGMALVRSGAVGQGLPYLARARRLSPQDPLGALWHGIALHASGRFAEAAAALQGCASLSPSDPAPLIHLVRALLKLGRPQDAVATARQALSLAPGLPEAQHALCLAELALLAPSGPLDATGDPQRLAEAWLGLGLACLRLGRVADARGAMQQALAVAPHDAGAASHLAMVEHLCGEPVTAVARLRGVLAEHPDRGTARLHLASRLILEGDAAAGLALLQGPIPDDVPAAHWHAQRIDALVRLGRRDEAWAALAQVPGPAGDAEILLCWQHFLLARTAGDRAAASLAERVAGLAGDPAAAGFEHRINAHFLLADLHHAERRRERAFAHWQHGHALLRAAQPFSRAQHEAFIDAVIGRFDRDRLANGARAANDDPSPVFIVGLPRTGTTLTEHILAAHPAVHGAGERLAIRETLQRLTGMAHAEDALARAAALDGQALTEAASDYLATLHALAPAAAVILDKMPDNFAYLGFIATLLPGARVICCTRDLRDVGASIFQHRFFGHHPYAHDLADLGWTMAQHERLLRHWRATLTLPLLEVDHAEWVTDFDATLRRVLDFVGLPYDAACARFHEQDRTVATASRDQISQPINARGVGRWRAYAAQLAPMIGELPPPMAQP